MVPVQATTQPSMGAPPSATFGTPSFDPYSTTPNAANTPPTLQPGGAGAGSSGISGWQAPGTASQPPYVFPNTGMGNPAFTQQPPVLFPNGMGVNTPNWGWASPAPGPYMRLFQDIRVRHTWLHGNNATNEMTIHDSEVGTTLNWPNFLFSGQPLQVSPVFIFHAWDGPDSSLTRFPSELPSRAYSAYLDAAWNPMVTPHFGGELDVAVGVYTDFDTISNDSVRYTGTGVLVLHLTPTVTLKGGVTYLDRVDKKLLPAGGILWQPNPNTRFDIFFPRPKLARYLWTVGNTPVWGYLNAEYGGGSWTIQRNTVESWGPGSTPVYSDVKTRVDINDLRVGGGLEWTHQCGLTAFFEVAYVWERELYFETALIPQPPDSPTNKHGLRDTIMLRGGLVY
jgi:hypothetical protein